jgi:hypothetical protein
VAEIANSNLYRSARAFGPTAFVLVALAACAENGASRSIQSAGNPIIADGSYYSADPAPLVVGDTLYIVVGRDEAPPDVNDFIMREWQLLATKDVKSGRWTHYPGFLRPEQIFKWAAPARAYAAQMVRGSDGRFYLYAPVIEANSKQEDAFAIGVAVADAPLGPWHDAHPQGPIVSQGLPQPNKIQNIDPTVLVDDDGRVYLYWGTFGQLRGVELEPDMVTPKGPVVEVRTLPGFFEASWLFKRGDTYYLVYADNQAGPNSPCTPAVYHACIAYGTATSPLGPWTYRGVILAPVSSTTSHPGIVEFDRQWYLVYHTADAKGGGHFRRSVAVDTLHWDDDEKPPRILEVKPTRAPIPPQVRSRNIAPAATAHASNEPVPVQYWIKALNDGRVRANPLPPDVWGTWTPNNPAQQWIEYRWEKPVAIDGSRIWFWADHPAGADEGVAPPKSWTLQYWDGSGWKAVPNPSGFGTRLDDFQTTRFDSVETCCVRATFDASGSDGHHAAVAVQEWEILATGNWQ